MLIKGRFWVLLPYWLVDALLNHQSAFDENRCEMIWRALNVCRFENFWRCNMSYRYISKECLQISLWTARILGHKIQSGSNTPTILEIEDVSVVTIRSDELEYRIAMLRALSPSRLSLKTLGKYCCPAAHTLGLLYRDCEPGSSNLFERWRSIKSQDICHFINSTNTWGKHYPHSTLLCSHSTLEP